MSTVVLPPTLKPDGNSLFSSSEKWQILWPVSWEARSAQPILDDFPRSVPRRDRSRCALTGQVGCVRLVGDGHGTEGTGLPNHTGEPVGAVQGLRCRLGRCGRPSGLCVARLRGRLGSGRGLRHLPRSPCTSPRKPHTASAVVTAKALGCLCGWRGTGCSPWLASGKEPASSMFCTYQKSSVQSQPLELGSVCTDKVSPQFAFAFDIDQSPAFARIT